MTLYSTKTLLDVYQDCALKLGSTRLVENFDFRSFADFVASAIVDVVNFSLPYNRWQYVNTMPISDLTAIPTRFLMQQRVLLTHNETTFVEARLTDIREFFNLALSKNSMNNATFENPIYTFWGLTTTQHDKIIRVAPAMTGT